MTNRAFIGLALILALAVIGFVLFSQYVQGFAPCELCLRERLPWYGVIGLGIAGLLIPPRATLSRWISILIAAMFIISIGLGLHHAGVEQGWWAGPEACTGGLTGAETVEHLRAIMHAAQLVRCDEISWKFLGLSMAAYNFLISLAASVAAIFAIVHSWGTEYD
jgi:disulfide bond formation protein DsbB